MKNVNYEKQKLAKDLFNHEYFGTVCKNGSFMGIYPQINFLKIEPSVSFIFATFQEPKKVEKSKNSWLVSN